MTAKLLTEHHLEFLSLKGGCIALYETTLVKIPHCWKSHVAAHFFCYLKRWKPGLEVIKPEYSLRLKIKRNNWLLTDMCPQAANHCAVF